MANAATTTLVTSAFDKAAYSAYEFVRAERDALKQAEIVYKRRIEELEKETKSLLKSYQDIYKENKVLRSKLEHGPDATRIRRFRADIKRNEEVNNQLSTEKNLLTTEVQALKREKFLLEEERKKIQAAFETERGLHLEKATLMEKETKEINKKIEDLEKAKEEYEFRLGRSEKESAIIIDKIKDEKRDKLKLETKYKKQIKLAEDEVETKNAEIKNLRTDAMVYKEQIAKTNSENTTLKYELETLKKKLEFQQKELDVYKHQAGKYKKDIEGSNVKYKALQDELRATEGMLEDAREDGVEAVQEERLELRRKVRKFKEHIAQLEDNIEELSRVNRELEKQVGEIRTQYENATIEIQNLCFAENAYKRRIEKLQEDILTLETNDPTKAILSRNTKGVVVTMGDSKVKHLEKEKAALVNRIKHLEREARWDKKRIRELNQSTSGAPQDYEENWTMVYRKKSGRNRNYRETRRAFLSSRSVDDTFKSRLSPLSLPHLR